MFHEIQHNQVRGDFMGFAVRHLSVVGLLSVLLTAPAVVQAQVARNPSAEAAYNEGLQLLEQEKPEEAIDAFKSALAIDGTGIYPDPLVGLGDAFRALEDYNSARGYYQQAITIFEAEQPSPEEEPLVASAYNGRGVCFRELGDPGVAVNDFDTASQLDRNNAEIAANYGDILVNYSGQDPNRAIQYLDRAIELDAENAFAYRNRGLARWQLQEFDEAIADLLKAIEIEPETYDTYVNLASIYNSQEEYESAIEAISKAIEYYKPEQNSDPGIYVQGYLTRSHTQLQIAKQDDTPEEKRLSLYQMALADADRILEEYPDRPDSGIALYQRGLALRLLERYSEAIKALTDALQLGGSESRYSANAYLKRGICWHYQKQDSLARGDLEQAASISFDDPLPHLWIGFTYAQEGDYRAAIESYGDAISRNPAFPAPYVNRGLAYMQLGDYGKAVANFNEAIRNEPTEAKHFYKRGVAYLKLEEYQKALDSFDLALLNGKTANAARGRAAALRGLGRDNLSQLQENQARLLEPAG